MTGIDRAVNFPDDLSFINRPRISIPTSPPDSIGAPERVVHVIAPAPFGGAESVVLALAGESRQAGFDDAVIALVGSPSHPFVDQCRARGIPVAAVPAGRRRYFQEARAVRRAAEGFGATVCHTHVYHADIVGYLAARPLQLPLVATHHGATGGDLKARLYEWIDWRVLRYFAGVVCVSASGRHRLLAEGIPADRIFLVPNGHAPKSVLTRAEARHRLGLGGNERLIGWIGRLSEEKGPDQFLQAMACLDGVAAVVVGDGPLKAVLEAEVRRQPGPGRIQFAGAQPEAGSLLTAFDLVVLSSRTEGLPIVLLEAMAAGVPVAAFAVGGIPEVLDASSGWLVPPERPDQLAAAIREALANPAEAARRAATAQLRIEERYSVKTWIRSMRAAYRTAASRHP